MLLLYIRQFFIQSISQHLVTIRNSPTKLVSGTTCLIVSYMTTLHCIASLSRTIISWYYLFYVLRYLDNRRGDRDNHKDNYMPDKQQHSRRSFNRRAGTTGVMSIVQCFLPDILRSHRAGPWAKRLFRWHFCIRLGHFMVIMCADKH